MKKVFGVVLIITFVCTGFQSSDPDLDLVRLDFYTYPKNKSLCKVAIKKLEANQNNSKTHLAYLGYLQTVWANHTINPVNKLSTFKNGKKNIELALKSNPNNLEIRLIRLSVQKNAPGFLGYNANIKEDTEFLKENCHQIKSVVLQKNIETLLSE
jgi:hypothetical protein